MLSQMTNLELFDHITTCLRELDREQAPAGTAEFAEGMRLQLASRERVGSTANTAAELLKQQREFAENLRIVRRKSVAGPDVVAMHEERLGNTENALRGLRAQLATQ